MGSAIIKKTKPIQFRFFSLESRFLIVVSASSILDQANINNLKNIVPLEQEKE